MTLVESLEQKGQWFFKWRSFMPLCLLALFVAALEDYQHPFGSRSLDQLWEAVCFLISLVGLSIRVLAVGCAAKGTSGRNMKRQVADSLNTSGMYSVVRHPLYLGNFIMILGLCLVPRIWWLPLIYVLLFALYYERIMLCEERFLSERFGAEFHAWAASTPAFFPKPIRWTRAEQPFSLKKALRAEYCGLFGLAAAFTVHDLLENLFLTGEMKVDAQWLTVFAVSLAAFLVIRTLHKKTGLLAVPGR